jgi:hypothetical protein
MSQGLTGYVVFEWLTGTTLRASTPRPLPLWFATAYWLFAADLYICKPSGYPPPAGALGSCSWLLLYYWDVSVLVSWYCTSRLLLY